MQQPVFYMPVPNRREEESDSGAGVCIAIFFGLIIVSAGLFCVANFDFSVLQKLAKDPTSLFQDQGEIREAFNDFVDKYGKEYASKKETEKRYQIFAENYRIIQDNNENNDDYTLGVNQFTDMSREEFKEFLGSFTPRKSKNVKKLRNFDADPNIDWDAKGYVAPVKNQGQCGSCWAFSAIGAVESLHAIKAQTPNDVTQYAEQELVDCSGSYGNEGCNGGWMDYAFEYIRDKGISLESEYPYHARDQKCQKKSSSFKLAGYTDVPENDSDQLLNALNIEPVSVAVEADEAAWQSYTGGIVTKNCGTDLDHGVLLVGSGHDSTKNLDFWRIKNSWGTSWGEKGFIRLLRKPGKGPGMCGIAMVASYPTA